MKTKRIYTGKHIPLIICIKDGLVDAVIPSTKEDCEREFIAQIQGRGFELISFEDNLDEILADGYFAWANGSVCLTWI